VCTILIVDDDVDTRETLAGNLREHGHSVLLAMNGRHALELLGLGRSMGTEPCLALVDLTMPVMDGWALLAALDRDGSWHRLQVIVSSGTDVSERRLSYPHAIVLWPKPLDPEKLARIQDQCPLHASTALTVAPDASSSGEDARARAQATERLPREARARRPASHRTISEDGHRPTARVVSRTGRKAANARRNRAARTR
jgi:CheY-like chemotaxis protein